MRTFDTVLIETSASRATSWRVGAMPAPCVRNVSGADYTTLQGMCTVPLRQVTSTRTPSGATMSRPGDDQKDPHRQGVNRTGADHFSPSLSRQSRAAGTRHQVCDNGWGRRPDASAGGERPTAGWGDAPHPRLVGAGASRVDEVDRSGRELKGVYLSVPLRSADFDPPQPLGGRQ